MSMIAALLQPLPFTALTSLLTTQASPQKQQLAAAVSCHLLPLVQVYQHQAKQHRLLLGQAVAEVADLAVAADQPLPLLQGCHSLL